MKRKTVDRITYALLAVGTAIVCAYSDILAGVILLTAFICWLAVSWVRFYADMLRDESEERAEEIAEERYQEMIENTEYHVEYRQFVGLGKGYK